MDVENYKSKIIKNITVPTGNILIVKGEKGKLECLSIGDYGKEKNLKADFLGLTKEINGVPHGELLSLEDKWVITISTQYGCSMGCTFCDVPKVGPGVNASVDDLVLQAMTGISLHPEVVHTNRLNLHYARMGEPSFNNNIFEATSILKQELVDNKGWGFHPVVSTMCPANKYLYSFISKWMKVKNEMMKGEAGLQISVNTTDETARKEMFSGNALSLAEISMMFTRIFIDLKREGKEILNGRKITLNFAITEKEIDASYLKTLFNPDIFLCKITPMHETKSCIDNKMLTHDGYTYYYPYKEVEENLKNEGFDVIVFIPSLEEDKSKITCGNAILAG